MANSFTEALQDKAPINALYSIHNEVAIAFERFENINEECGNSLEDIFFNIFQLETMQRNLKIKLENERINKNSVQRHEKSMVPQRLSVKSFDPPTFFGDM